MTSDWPLKRTPYILLSSEAQSLVRFVLLPAIFKMSPILKVLTNYHVKRLKRIKDSNTSRQHQTVILNPSHNLAISIDAIKHLP